MSGASITSLPLSAYICFILLGSETPETDRSLALPPLLGQDILALSRIHSLASVFAVIAQMKSLVVKSDISPQ